MTGAGGGGALLAHVALIVRDLSVSERLYAKIFGISATGRTVVAEEGVRVSFLSAGYSRIELLEPQSSSGPVARFLEERGEGIHHLAFEVPDLDVALASARGTGLQVTGGGHGLGAEGTRIAFVHPQSTHGLLVELIERREGVPRRGSGE